MNIETLRQILHYSVITGEFYWLKSTGRRVKAGDVAGALFANGYRRIGINYKNHSAHRLAWFWVTGGWPARHIDHKNGIRDANYWLNLREATRSQNGCNRGMQSNNTSKYKGVCWNKNLQKWQAQIKLHGKMKYLGLFGSIDEAYSARLMAEKELHGEFTRN